ATRAGFQPTIPTKTVIAQVRTPTPLLHLFAGAIAVVGAAVLVQILGGLSVLVHVRGLVIGTLEARVVLPDAQPGQCTDDAFCPLGAVAGRVGVLHAQHHAAVGVLLRQGPVEQRRARA